MNCSIVKFRYSTHCDGTLVFIYFAFQPRVKNFLNKNVTALKPDSFLGLERLAFSGHVYILAYSLGLSRALVSVNPFRVIVRAWKKLGNIHSTINNTHVRFRLF